ncbi:DUF3280 domain-containing protein [Methylosinus sp. Ce-a6]|uniref:DUF3280 domain-containing protein n=1 Tax=Methylosinus sp. Ce-a6 TaxID=2172005 RepID=UPI0013599852|nr:DUF3280 domain-containing protein [Methylosinus sp. Ce-a6]
MKRLIWIAACLLVASACAMTPALATASERPRKIAVFDLELDDFSAGGPLAGESPAETKRLAEMTRLARDLLAASGLFEIVDVAAAKDPMVETHRLRKCNGCDADVARGLGAELSFVGFFRKVSVMVQSLVFYIRDTKSGALVDISQTDFRGETDESWRRALTWLIRHRLVERDLARRGGVAPE